MRAAALLLLAGCGLNIGSPPRRVFPNPMSTASLDRLPITSGVATPIACRIRGATGALVDYAAPSPWGVEMKGGDARAALTPVPEVLSALHAQIRGALAGCPAGPPARWRVVVDLVETNLYQGDYDVARVVLRMERYATDFGEVASWRAVGAVRTRNGAVALPGLVRLATADALAELLRVEGKVMR